MKNKVGILFAIPTLIWGTTWYAIKFQLDGVDSLVSIIYRFSLAGLLLFAYCLIRRLPMKFGANQHYWIALQGLFLFGVNYWLTYVSEETLASGLVAMIYATLIFFIVVLNRIFIRTKTEWQTVVGGSLGIVGTFFLFYEEIMAFNLANENLQAVIICLVSVVLAAVGNVLSSRNQMHQIPIMQSTAWAMLYASGFMVVLAFGIGTHFSFNTNFSYLSTLLYLAVLGSIIASIYYLRLIKEIGGDKASYVILITPIIAILISTIFEDFKWTFFAFVGTLFILGGNAIAIMRKPRKKTLLAK